MTHSTQSHSERPPTSPLRNPRTWLTTIACWAGFAVLNRSVHGVETIVDGQAVPLSSWHALRSMLLHEGVFAIGTVVMLHLAPRLLRRRGSDFWWRGLAAVLALSYVHQSVHMLGWQPWGQGELGFLLLGGVIYGFHYAAILGAAMTFAQRRTSQLRERELIATQLRALRAQLQPHFLFNTLQAIGATAPRDGALAARMTTLLGDLLRHTLRERDGSLVSLAEEQLLLQPYLQLQQLRFSDRLRVEVDIPTELLGAAVPDLLLQPLVENALQHGLEQLPGAGSITIRARRAADQLRLEVLDSGKSPPRADGELRLGTGLGATKARLRALYGESASLALEPNEQGGTTSIVALPFSELRHAA